MCVPLTSRNLKARSDDFVRLIGFWLASDAVASRSRALGDIEKSGLRDEANAAEGRDLHEH